MKVHKKNLKNAMETIVAYLLLFALVLSIFAIGYRVYEIKQIRKELDNAPTDVYLVQEGDRLWTIAERTGFDNQDPRDIVDRIQELNDMKTVDIYPGDILIIPVKDSK